jgi:hypothetical protein
VEIFKFGLVYVPVTALIYMIVGEKSFMIVHQERFDKLITLFFLCAGSIILMQ